MYNIDGVNKSLNGENGMEMKLSWMQVVGTGLLTKLLGVPRGKVYAVDMDSNMITHAKRYLKDLENVQVDTI